MPPAQAIDMPGRDSFRLEVVTRGGLPFPFPLRQTQPRRRVRGIERCLVWTREISLDQWQAFFNDFTCLHLDEHVNVETIRRGEVGVRQCLCDLPLLGIVSTLPEPGQVGWIEVVVRDPTGAPAAHAISHPSRVRLAEENNDAVALQVDSEDGSVTMIRFEPPRENMPEGYTIS
jgi:hypothetical protein